jgi:hypothetical protein
MLCPKLRINLKSLAGKDTRGPKGRWCKNIISLTRLVERIVEAGASSMYAWPLLREWRDLRGGLLLSLPVSEAPP